MECAAENRSCCCWREGESTFVSEGSGVLVKAVELRAAVEQVDGVAKIGDSDRGSGGGPVGAAG